MVLHCTARHQVRANKYHRILNIREYLTLIIYIIHIRPGFDSLFLERNNILISNNHVYYISNSRFYVKNRLLERLTSMESSQQELLKEQQTAVEASLTAAAKTVSSSRQKPSLTTDTSSLEAVLEEHHARTRQTVIFSTLLVAVFTPIAVFTCSKIM